MVIDYELNVTTGLYRIITPKNKLNGLICAVNLYLLLELQL